MRLYHAGHIDLPTLFRAMSLNPARRLGLPQGRLAVGAPADLVLFDPDAPFLLENFLVNEMFSEGFPFSETSPYDHFLKLVTQFGLLRFMLAVQCNEPERLPDLAQLVRTVQVFSRKYQHDADFAKRVNGALKNAGWDSLEKIYRFLRT